MVHGFGPNLAAVGPKLDPDFLRGQADGRQALTMFAWFCAAVLAWPVQAAKPAPA